MKILFDHNTPAPLRYALKGHHVETAYERGWAELTNGELLAAAESNGFEVMITTDKGIQYEQNLSRRTIALIVLSSNDWMRIRRFQSLVVSAVTAIEPGKLVEVKFPAS